MEPTPMYCFSQTCLTSPSLTWVFSNRRIANRKVMVLANRFLSTNAFLILKARRGVGRDDWRDEGKAQKIKDINQLLFRYGNRRFKTAPKKSSKIVLKTYMLRKMNGFSRRCSILSYQFVGDLALEISQVLWKGVYHC